MFKANSSPTTRMSQQKSRHIRACKNFPICLSLVNYKLSFLFLSDRECHLAWPYDAVAHLLVSSEMLFCIRGEKWLFVCLNQSGNSTYLINNGFPLTELPLTRFLSFFLPFSVNPRDVYSWKSSRSSVFEITPVNTSRSKLLKHTFLSHNNAEMKISR